jgi:hypothetical protein
MILFMNVFITNDRPFNRYSRIDIFKYALESYKKLTFTEVYLFLLLDNEFLQPGQYFYENDLTEYLHSIFSNLEKDKIHIVLDRYVSQEKWIPFFNELMQKHGPNESVWVCHNDDHVFIDFNTDVLLEGLELLENDTSKYKTLSYSHWPESMKIPGKLQNTEKINNYIRLNVSCVDGMQIFNLQFLYHIYVEHKWNSDHRRIDTLAIGELFSSLEDIFNNKLNQVIYIPLRELCRHFDGYDHVHMDRDACPLLELPHNTFKYTRELLIKKMTASHHSFCTENNDFTPPQDWIDTMLKLHNVSEYTL